MYPQTANRVTNVVTYLEFIAEKHSTSRNPAVTLYSSRPPLTEH